MAAHGSGPMRVATPSSWGTCTSYSLPVLTGAPQILVFCIGQLRPPFRAHYVAGELLLRYRFFIP
jgi:hypothetical protein